MIVKPMAWATDMPASVAIIPKNNANGKPTAINGSPAQKPETNANFDVVEVMKAS
jgi:hypothetical protein